MPTCTKDGLTTASNCFFPPNFSQHELSALIVYRLMQILASTGGSNYVLSGVSTLWTDSNSATCGFSEEQTNVGFFAVLNYAWGASTVMEFTDAIPALTKDTAATAVACLKNYSDIQLKKMQLYLLCSIGNRVV